MRPPGACDRRAGTRTGSEPVGALGEPAVLGHRPTPVFPTGLVYARGQGRMWRRRLRVVDPLWREQDRHTPFGGHRLVVGAEVIVGATGGGVDLAEQQPQPLRVDAIQWVVPARPLGPSP